MYKNENCKIWSSENTPVLSDKSSLPQKKTCVWLALSRRRFVGLVFFIPAVEGETCSDIITHFVSVLDEMNAAARWRHMPYCWLNYRFIKTAICQSSNF